jgi:hypothetical protein
MSFTASASGVVLPIDFIRIVRVVVALSTPALTTNAVLVSSQKGTRIGQNIPTGLSRFARACWIEENQLFVQFNAGEVGVTSGSRLVYITDPSSLASDTSEPALPLALQDAIPYFAAWIAMLRSKEDGTGFWNTYMARLQSYAAKFKRQLDNTEIPEPISQGGAA